MNATPKASLLKKLLAGSLLFYVFSGVSSVLNYIFYPIVARFVTTSQYGEIQFLVSMFTQLAVGFVVLNILAIVISAQIKEHKEQLEAIKSLNVVSCIVILVVVVIGSVVLYTNKTSLGLSDSTAIVALGLSLVINVPFTVAIGHLQGNGHFMASGVLSTLGSFLKLVFSVIFIMMGFGVGGAILGIGIGMLITLILVEIVNKRSVDPKPKTSFIPTKAMFQRLVFIRERAVIAIIALTVITLLSSADSIVSRLFFDTHSAGQYAAVATLAKVILAATSPLMWLALPPAVSRDRQKIMTFLSITAAISFSACIIFSLAPTFFLQTLLGIDAGVFTSVLPLASIAMALCSIAFVLVSVSVCLGTLRNLFLSSLSAVASYFIVFLTLQLSLGSLYGSLYGQIIASLCFIIGGLLALRSRHFTS
jgi:O-antigen/teichoic acid export membrane protein